MPTTDREAQRRASEGSTPAAPAAPLRFELVATLDDLEALAPAWRPLLADRQVFVGPDWTIEWLKGPGARAQPFVVAAREPDGTLAGVLPLCARRGVLATCGAEHGFAHGDVVAAPGRASEVAEGALALLDGLPWSHLRLERLSLDGALLAAARARAGRMTVLEKFGAACPTMTVKPDWPSQLSSMARHHRHELTRQMRRFAEKPGSRVQWVSEPSQVDAAMRLLFDLHERRFAALGRETAFAGPAIRSFHAALAHRLMERGALVLGVLLDADRPVAAAYGFSSAGATSFFNAGIEPEFARTGAGFVLRGLMLKDQVIDAGRREFDLLEGCQEWKLRWATGVRPLLDVDVFPAGVAGAVSGGLRNLVRTLRKKAAVAIKGERGPGSPNDEPADPKHCRRLGCPYAPEEAAPAADGDVEIAAGDD